MLDLKQEQVKLPMVPFELLALLTESRLHQHTRKLLLENISNTSKYISVVKKKWFCYLKKKKKNACSSVTPQRLDQLM